MAKIRTGQISDSSEVWTTWVPTLSGRFDDTKWTKTGRYVRIGRTIHFTLKLVANNTTPMSGGSTDAQFTLPVAASGNYQGGDQNALIGVGGIYDSGSALYKAVVGVSSSSLSNARIRVEGAGGTYANMAEMNSTVPMTWTTSDEISISGTYEV